MARLRGSTWQAEFRLSPTKRLRPGGFETQTEAELWEAQAKAAHEKGLPLPPVPAKPAGAPVAAAGSSPVAANTITLGALRKLVLETPKRRTGGGWLGAKDYRNAVQRSQAILDFFGENTKASDIDLNEMERWSKAMRNAGNKPGTINRKLAVLSKMLTFAEQRKHITTRPSVPLEDEPEGRTRFLEPAEAHRILAMLEIMGEHDFRQLTIFLLETGARVSEAFDLLHPNVRLGKKPTARFEDTKNGASRTVPLTPAAVSAVTFFNGRNESGPFADMNYWGVREIWDRCRTRLGAEFRDVTIHIFRHTRCSWLVQDGVDLRRVQVLMGHKDIKTTLRYAHLAPDHLSDVADVMARRMAIEAPQQAPQEASPVAAQAPAEPLAGNVVAIRKRA